MRVWRAEYSLSFSVALSWYFSSSLSLFAVSVLVSLSVSRFLFLCLLLSFSFSFPFSSLSLSVFLLVPSVFASVFVPVSVAVFVGSCLCLYLCVGSKVVGEHRSPTLAQDGGRDFGRPGSILRKRGADRPGAPSVHRRSGEPSNTATARHKVKRPSGTQTSSIASTSPSKVTYDIG